MSSLITYGGKIITSGNKPIYYNYPNNYSMDFFVDGVNSKFAYISDNSSAINNEFYSLTPKFSISFWFKRNNVNLSLNDLALISFNTLGYTAPLIMHIYGDLTFRISAQDNFSLSTQNNSISANVWYHITFTYDYSQANIADIVKVYWNGVKITNFKTLYDAGTRTFHCYGNENFCIGGTHSGSNNAYSSIDDVTFWNKVLTDAEAKELYNYRTSKNVSLMNNYSTNCLGWWKMGDDAIWNGSIWTIPNVKGTTNTDLIGTANLLEADRTPTIPA